MPATTFPTDIPAVVQVNRCTMNLVRYDEGTFFKGGVGQVVEYSPPRWKITIQTIPLILNDIHRIHAWWESMRGQMGTFLAYDYSHPYPVGYPTGGGVPPDDTVTVAAYSSGGYVIDLNGLDPGYVVTTGDWLSLKESGKRSLHKATEDRVADGSGHIGNLAIAPRVLTNVFTTAATITLVKGKGKFQPIKDSFEFDPYIEQTPLKFQGIEVYK